MKGKDSCFWPTRGSVINESLIFVSYHNIDVEYAFQLSTLLIRYYRNIWLDRFEIAPLADWNAKIREARDLATGAIAIVSDDFLGSTYCRAEFEYFHERGIPVTAVIPRDFSTDRISGFAFNDWVDFRRWFDDPNDLSVENLLSQIPQSESVAQTGERQDALRSFIQASELALAKLPSAWTAQRNGDAPGAGDMRPRMLHSSLIRDWDFTSMKAGNSLPVEDLLQWSQSEPQFIIRGDSGSGKTFFARLLALVQAHEAKLHSDVALPIWIDLAQWDGRFATFDAFMEAQWPLVSFWRHWLEGNNAFVVLDNWNDLCAANQAYANQVSNWIDASPNHRFVLLSTRETPADPSLPRLRLNRLTTAFAQKLAGGYLTLNQQNGFRQLLREKAALVETSQLAYLTIGMELFAADRALAFNQWQSHPMSALVSTRLQQFPAMIRDLNPVQLLTSLRGLAWSMMLQDNHRFIARAAAERQVTDARIIDCALHLGILSACGDQLRFESTVMQHFLAAENLKKDGLIKYLTRPEFAADSGRVRQKWDGLVLIAVDSLAEEARPRIIDQIADIDPFLAVMCLCRNKTLYKKFAETPIAKLIQLCAQNPNAQDAFRVALAGLPDPDLTTVMMLGQMSRFSNPQQLWLWHEVRALPLELPVNFIDIVRHLDRDSNIAVADQIADYNLSLAVAWLVKLSQHPDGSLRRNAIWMLGEIKYLPTAILLLDYLEDPERDDHGEVVLALMRFAYSEILVRVLQWSQDHPTHREAVIAALATRKRLVTSRLLSFADARKLTLNPEFYEIVVNTYEIDIAIGLAQIASQHVELPDSVAMAVIRRKNAGELQQRIAATVKHWPNRDGFQQLVEDIALVLGDPPESTVIAGSNIDALLYGQPLFDEFNALAERAPDVSLPDELAQQLRHADWRERHRALNSLLDHPAETALPILLEMTDDEETNVRLAVYEFLSRFDDEVAAQKAIIAALADPDRDIVDSATKLLKAMSGLDYEALLDLLDSANPATVAAAIEILAAAQYAAAAPALRRLLDDERITANGGQTIGQRARAALDAIDGAGLDGAGAFETDGSQIDVAKTPALQTFGDEEKIARTLQVLRDDDWGRTQKAAKFLRKFAKHLRGSDNHNILRQLLGALGDGNWSVRWAATEALAMLGNRKAIPQLAHCLADSNRIVQVAAIRALVELGAGEKAANISPLLESQHQSVREAAAEALGELSDTRVIPALGDALTNDADEFVRYAALKSIHQINAAAARPWLELALSDGYAHIRLLAMQQLAPRMNESDLPILQQLLIDDALPSWENESLRDLAIQTLQRIDTPECRELLDAEGVAAKRNGV